MVTNSRRCHSSMNACPEGFQYLKTLYHWMGSSSGIFSPSRGIPGGAHKVLTPEVIGQASHALPFAACASVYAVIQLLLFVISMHSLWLNEYTSRLEFLAETDAVDVEWWLESQRRPKVTEWIVRGVELVVTFLVLASVVTTLVPEILMWHPLLVGTS